MISCLGVILGSLLGFIPAIQVLTSGVSFEEAWQGEIPSLTLALGVDNLSAFFLVAILFISALTAIYSLGYLKGQPHVAKYFSFFPLLVGAMEAVVVARDGFLFLICWEVMSLASFFLVTAEHESHKVRHAGWIYLIATHVATGFLILFFALLFGKVGSFDFGDFAHLSSLPASLSNLLFLLALVGFGTKAGLFPFHVWLPHAHPAAPSPISALMSGVMIKTGIYGILRTLTFLGPPPLWWGETLLTLGILSAVLGVLYALMQHDLKRLLAYHSVENIGIIVIGIGLGFLGTTLHRPLLQLFGFTGALFHVWNHAIFKGLLFLGAGSLVHATHTRFIDRLGGVLKKMPITGTVFLIASAAICGLPPLNGFISEWLIYMGLFHASQSSSHFPLFLVVAGIIGVAFAGGLAVACFTKVFGVVFLGEPRTTLEGVKESSPLMGFPMIILALLCLALGLYPQLVLPLLVSVSSHLNPSLSSHASIQESFAPLETIRFVFLLLLIFTTLSLLVWRLWFKRKTTRTSLTWDCGYTLPSSRMQYTSSSFAEPVGSFFRVLLKPVTYLKADRFEEHVHDFSERVFFGPLFAKISSFLSGVRARQSSTIQAYLKLIFITLMALLLWEVWFGI